MSLSCISTGKATRDPSSHASIPCSLEMNSDQKVFLSSDNLLMSVYFAVADFKVNKLKREAWLI